MGQFEAQDFDVVVSSETAHSYVQFVLASAHQILQILTISEDALSWHVNQTPRREKHLYSSNVQLILV